MIALPRLRAMTSTVTSLSRRLLAASATLGLALTVSACTIGETDDDKAAAATSGQSAADGSAASAPAEGGAEKNADATGTDSGTDSDEKARGDAKAGGDAPAAGIDELVLNSSDAPELGLAPVPAEEITGGMDALGDLARDVKVDPPHCADLNQDALTAQAEPGTIAIQSGMQGQTAFAVALTTKLDGLPQRAGEIEKCPVMTVTIPIEGQEMVSETTNTTLDQDAPEGVKDFAAVRQDTSMDVGGQAMNSGTVMITGTVRGIGVSVTGTSALGELTPEAQATAMDVFAKQVEKIRNA